MMMILADPNADLLLVMEYLFYIIVLDFFHHYRRDLKKTNMFLGEQNDFTMPKTSPNYC